MMRKLLAIGAITAVCSLAWLILGVTMGVRATTANSLSTARVVELWGGEHRQAAPQFNAYWVEMVKDAEGREKGESRSGRGELLSSDVKVALDMEYRQKGFVWFPTYVADFAGEFRFRNASVKPASGKTVLDFPSKTATYDDLKVSDGEGRPLDFSIEGGRIVVERNVAPHEEMTVKISYRTRGLRNWSYSFGEDVQKVKDFRLVMTTNFDEIDFPEGTLSPDSKARRGDGGGWTLVWEKEDLINGKPVGMALPERINPGELGASMAGSAPVGLLFFFSVLFISQTKRRIDIHPLNYTLLGAGFFAFNLLFAYLVDHVSVGVSFGLSAAVSLALVIPYLGRAFGWRFALLDAGLCQVCFQLLFAMAHFLKGFTGLSITLGAIATLAVIMHSTARLRWGGVGEGEKAGLTA